PRPIGSAQQVAQEPTAVLVAPLYVVQPCDDARMLRDTPEDLPERGEREGPLVGIVRVLRVRGRLDRERLGEYREDLHQRLVLRRCQAPLGLAHVAGHFLAELVDETVDGIERDGLLGVTARLE